MTQITPPLYPAEESAGFFSAAQLADFRKEVLKLMPVDSRKVGEMPEGEQKALYEAAMLGATVAFFAKDSIGIECVDNTASRCEVSSRRRLLRIMRGVCLRSNPFRYEAFKFGSQASESQLRSFIVRFARKTSLFATKH